VVQGYDPFGPDGNVLCSQLATTPALGQCQPGAVVARIAPDLTGNGGGLAPVDRPFVPLTTPISAARLVTRPVKMLAVATDGSVAAIEQVRTDLENVFPGRFQPVTIAEDSAQSDNAQRTTEYRQLINVILLTSLPIAGCSLAVAVAAGLADRKRAFSLLRLAGAPLAMLRRVVVLETAMPLVVIAVFSSAIGFLATSMFVRSQLAETLQPPGSSYFVLAAAGLIASLAIIASTFPLLARITGAETARND
jgi:predicted lysophospholipase L1 biosynthesis ABC-type transport system permease subunit